MEKKTCLEKLRELAEEYERGRRMRPEEWAKEQLRWENWPLLRKQAVSFAARELRRRGRGRGAVLPGGYDAESIAGEAIADVLAGKSRLILVGVMERVTKELERLIRGKIRSLGMLKETSAVRSDSALDEARDPGGDGCEALVDQEQEQQRERMRRELEEFLADEPELVGLLGCSWRGIRDTAEIGRRLGLDEKGVLSARRRLERRFSKWRRLKLRGVCHRELPQ